MEEGGARRDAKGWKDTFNHMKTTFKIKLRNLRQSRHETGGGEILERHLLTPEDWLLEKFLRCAGDGHPQIGEIGVRGRTNVAFALQRPEDCDGTVQQSDAREVSFTYNYIFFLLREMDDSISSPQQIDVQPTLFHHHRLTMTENWRLKFHHKAENCHRT